MQSNLQPPIINNEAKIFGWTLSKKFIFFNFKFTKLSLAQLNCVGHIRADIGNNKELVAFMTGLSKWKLLSSSILSALKT